MKLDLNKLLREVEQAVADNNVGDPYNFMSMLSEKYFSKIDPNWGERRADGEDVYTDILFTICEHYGIEFY